MPQTVTATYYLFPGKCLCLFGGIAAPFSPILCTIWGNALLLFFGGRGRDSQTLPWRWKVCPLLILSPSSSLNWSRFPHIGQKWGDHNIPVLFHCTPISAVVQTLQVLISLTILCFLHSIYDYQIGHGGLYELWWEHLALPWVRQEASGKFWAVSYFTTWGQQYALRGSLWNNVCTAHSTGLLHNWYIINVSYCCYEH